MRKVLAATLGILTAVGGFVDIGDLVTNAVVGSRFGLSLGEYVNGRVLNAAGMVYLVIVVAAAVAAIPLMIATGAGS
jgi:hypothetical protein